MTLIIRMIILLQLIGCAVILQQRHLNRHLCLHSFPLSCSSNRTRYLHSLLLQACVSCWSGGSLLQLAAPQVLPSPLHLVRVAEVSLAGSLSVPAKQLLLNKCLRSDCHSASMTLLRGFHSRALLPKQPLFFCVWCCWRW